MSTLDEEIRALPLSEKERIYENLSNQIHQAKGAEIIKDVSRLQDLVCSEMGIPRITPSREANNVIARVIIADLLLSTGMSESETARAMGINRTSVYQYKNIMKTWLSCPVVYRRELTMWNNIKQQYETYR